jgi:type VI secretion system secreted protein Hcp
MALIIHDAKAMKTLPSLSRTLALTMPAVALSLTGAHGASDYLLEIDGIKGESTDEKHRDSIEIESFSWGATNSGSVAKAITLSLGKRIDKASPQLFLACAKGNHIPQATLVCRKTTGGGKQDYYVITLSDILVSSYQSAAGGGSGGTAGTPLPVDQISFNYAKIKIEYTRYDDAGQQVEDPIVVEHDFTGTAQ